MKTRYQAADKRGEPREREERVGAAAKAAPSSARPSWQLALALALLRTPRSLVSNADPLLEDAAGRTARGTGERMSRNYSSLSSAGNLRAV
jgi:hypothetical protein